MKKKKREYRRFQCGKCSLAILYSDGRLKCSKLRAVVSFDERCNEGEKGFPLIAESGQRVRNGNTYSG